MVKKKKAKKVSKKRSATKSQDNKILLFVGAALVFVVLAIAFNKGSNKPPMESVNVKDNKVSDIKKTNDAKPLTIPKKVKAITKPTFNEKEVQIRFAEIDYNSDKKISQGEYLYYFKDKAAGKKQFARVDKNKDGSITYDEYLSFKKR
ncbi:MAG: EF-hand domain-containing protein [Pelagibacteraceae bacterium]